MQLAAAETFADRVNPDPLAESENLQSFRDFMLGAGVPDESIEVTVDLLTARPLAVVAREPRVTPQVMEQFEIDEIVTDDPPNVRPDKRRKAEKHSCSAAG